MKVRWTEQAFVRLAEIEDYIARDDPVVALEHTRRLTERSQVLADFPRMGRPLPELPGSDLRELIEGRYRIVYRLREDRVEILTVFEGHRLLPAGEVEGEP